MRASCKASYIDRSFIGGLTRATAAAVLVAVLLLAQVTLASAGTLVPAADAGGPGGGGESVTDMLRGSYSPVDITLEIAVTEVEAPLTVAEMIRGDYSPIDAAPEVTVIEVQSVAEQLRGAQSPIPFDVI